MISITAYIGRENEHQYRLLQNGQPVVEGAVSRVRIKFGPYCLDTDQPDDPIEVDAEGVVTFRPGMVEGLQRGMYEGQLVVYDNPSPEGIVWDSVIVTAVPSPACEAMP